MDDVNKEAARMYENMGENMAICDLDKIIFAKGVIFFGCGKLCHEMLRRWRWFGVYPEYLCDNNKELWGRFLEGIEIIRPNDLPEMDFSQILLATTYKDEIYEQLAGIGIDVKKIKDTAYPLEEKNLKTIALAKSCCESNIIADESHQVYIDLSCGMVLGGVEQWSYRLGGMLAGLKRDVRYFVPCMEPLDSTKNFNRIILGDEDKADCKISVFMDAVERLACAGSVAVILNFPFEIFQAAAYSKRLFNKSLKLIAVVHNDEELYYRIYSEWKDEVDCYVAISKRIHKKLLEYGIPDSRIRMLKWNMDFPYMERNISKKRAPIRIGYAGRITTLQKRSDLLQEVMAGLIMRKIDFVFEIAGDGDYRKELVRWINEHHLENARCIGVIEQDKIYDFWNRQDVYLSVSEWEGHSISQAEAMAMGAVPIVTDVSGVEDDITDGVSGFIVGIGDIKAIVERIGALYQDREMLHDMSEAAKRSVRQCSNDSENAFWREMLEDV